MSRAWALVIPSRADTSPNVVKEARVVGMPIIASPHGGQAGYVRHEEDGLLVTTADPHDWFQAMMSLTTDFEKTRRFGAINHERYRDYFRPQNTSRAFLELYRKLIAS
jgi:glycosyltransferase involved in cell wall biosynthesis